MSRQKRLDEMGHAYLGKRIVYTKQGSRNGWRGTVQSILGNGERVQIEYDNGLMQPYDISAIHGEWAYLEVTSQPSDMKDLYDMSAVPVQHPNNQPVAVSTRAKVQPYAVVSMQGKLLEMFQTEDEAVQFATEQVVDAPTFTKLHILQVTMTVQPKQVKVEVERVN